MRNISKYLSKLLGNNVTYDHRSRGGLTAIEFLSYMRRQFDNVARHDIVFIWISSNDVDGNPRNTGVYSHALVASRVEEIRQYFEQKGSITFVLGLPYLRLFPWNIEAAEYRRRANKVNKWLYNNLHGCFIKMPTACLKPHSYSKKDGCHLKKHVYSTVANIVKKHVFASLQ